MSRLSNMPTVSSRAPTPVELGHFAAICFAWMFVMGAVSFLVATPVVGSEPVEPFLKKYCLRCHDAENQEGEFRLDTLKPYFADPLVAQRWDEVLIRIHAGEMPPEDQAQPTAREVGEIAEWIATRIDEGRAARMSRRGPVALYRLSREEYAHAVYDLLGIHFDVNAPGAFSDDPRWRGFDRIGSMLSLSPSHVERYFEAAEQIVAAAFPQRAAQPTQGRIDINDSKAQAWLTEQKVDGPVRELLLPGVLSRNTIHARQGGLYRIRIQLSGLPSIRGRIPHLAIWDSKVKRSLASQDVLAEEDTPTTIELETFLPAGRFHLLNQAPGTFEALTLALTRNTPFTRLAERRHIHPSSYKLLDDKGASIFPLLIVDSMQWEGPILTEQHQRKRASFFPAKIDISEAEVFLKRFIEKAWRRPAEQADVERFMKVIHAEVAAGEDWLAAYRSALVAVLTSKNFYYHIEGSADRSRGTVNQWELASRLSFFLWSSMPDDSLFAAAHAGDLSNEKGLREQLDRMLDDPKVDRFLDSFARGWLQLHKVGMFPPDPELYPEYDAWLEKSMVLESTKFFAEMFQGNRPIQEFLSSDWTMMNSRLAMHYGFKGIDRPGFQRVMLTPGDHRGGVLTHASVLALTSDGTRHRPVHRGVLLSEMVFGKTPPPPPPNVEPLAPTPADSPKATVRGQLEAHATHATCASCHRKIDPLGFAFDNYDAIGRWRTIEQVEGMGEDPQVNASGVLPGGRTFDGPEQLKQLLVEDLDAFATALVRQLSTYALRRAMTIDDQSQIQSIVQASKPSGYKLRTLIENLVLSDLFRQR